MAITMRLPLLFVFLWSTAYIALEHCSAYVEPATFVVVRAFITASILFVIVLVTTINWPKRWQEYLHTSVVGILIHGVYGGGMLAAIYYGLDLVVCALVLSLQPLLTVILSSLFLSEQITKRKAFGVLLGLLGVSIVVLEGSADNTRRVFEQGLISDESSSLFSLLLCAVALLAISSATIVQKRHCSETHPIAGTCIQYAAAAIVMLPIALVFESMQIDWNLSFVLGLGWLVVFVSIGAMSLLMMLIKQGEVGSVASLLYLVTPMVAIEAMIFFGDEITVTALIGMLLCMTAVIIVNYVSAEKAEILATQPRVSTSH